MRIPFIFLFIVTAAALIAQEPTASLHGMLTDSSGAVIPAANVALAFGGTQKSTQTLTDGSYSFTGLAAGDYKVSVAFPGFNFKDGISEDVYRERGNLRFFRGTHPAVMRDVMASQQWHFDHGIGNQPPDWLRHACVWVDLYRRRALPFSVKLAHRFRRALLERSPEPEK